MPTAFASVPASLDSGELMLGRPQHEQPASDGGRLWRFRVDLPANEATLPARWGDSSNPLVYVTYDSVTARQPQFAPLYEATLGALADLPVRVLMTTGRGLDPANLAPIPANSQMEQWWQQQAVMGAATALVDNVWLGGGVIVGPGVTIGENTVVGAGAVVVRDLPANVVAVGNPARVIRTIES
jgi:acetyltransferase-like isoleucine patch superfamily enzyme